MLNMAKRVLGIAVIGLSASTAWASDIVVGGKGFTEQLIMASMTEQYLTYKGLDVAKKDGMGSALLRKAQINGQVDVYWEYTGTSLVTYNKVKDKMPADDVYAKVKQMDAEQGLVWLHATKANSTYALAMQRSRAEALGIATISDLAAHIKSGNKLTLASDTEFYARPDGLRPLLKEYGFSLKRDEIVRMDAGIIYQALKNGDVDIGLVFATDGRIPAFDFVVIRDDRDYFPAYEMAPVIRQDTLEKHPELSGWLNELAARIDDQVMARLNGQVDVERVSIEDAARGFLQQQGLL